MVSLIKKFFKVCQQKKDAVVRCTRKKQLNRSLQKMLGAKRSFFNLRKKCYSLKPIFVGRLSQSNTRCPQRCVLVLSFSWTAA